MITESAKKAHRQSLRRRERNVTQKEALQKVLKTYKKLLAGKKTDAAKAQLAAVYKALDKTAKKGIIKPNKASRLKSRLAHQLGTLSK
ncbi:MAG: 30S ribosomal protein S20 [bacterium]|nr:30S ribosomal protein S20 [bacterium]